ncbi:hypothetical protein CEXT_585151 [Caerostris extrusa]|uniref:Uncharacterized protein n=1 Tax=Caerostris extrusa TaxID=172846 RepID=A0AAV4QJV9_CAEEX|nr:hypothetical protein CEXT_585151 [Caerostris extrusa]
MTLNGSIANSCASEKTTRLDVGPAIRHGKEIESTRSRSLMPYTTQCRNRLVGGIKGGGETPFPTLEERNP